MLTMFSARECIDKEKFIYESIGSSGRECLVLVPNQYTLVAEEQALRYLDSDCLFNTEILSMNRLGHRILTEKGMESVQMLSRYGRLMLLTRIVAEHKDELELFAKSAGKISFTGMLDDFVISFKQQDCSIEQLREMLDDEESNVILRRKLTELSGIISDYEAEIEGRYIDSEDYINMYVDAIKDSQIAVGKDIWIYGYDSITPKFTRAMLELSKKAESVNLIINESDYGLDEKVRAAVRAAASEAGISFAEVRISEEYAAVKSEAIRRIESGLCGAVIKDEDIERNSDFEPEGIELVQCANQYYEAESAAAYIHRLVRDEGYELRDIAVICNSEDKLQPVVKRALQEYGLPVFMDSSRAVTDTAGVVFVVNLLATVRYRYNTDRILAMLKTGLAGVDAAEIEDLENYAREYNIRGTMWAKDFKYRKDELSETALEKINETRRKIAEPIAELIELAENAENTGAFTDSFRDFLESRFMLSERIEEKAQKQEQLGYIDEAQRMRISIDEAYKLLAQIKEIMSDYPLDIAEMCDIYNAGLTSEEVGVIPPSLDGLSMGTLIRTRPRPAKAVIILGANEGILPLQPSAEGLFSVDEKSYFRKMDFALGDIDDLKMLEENTALYRMLSHASERLYISYSMTDIEGGELIQSPVVDSLQQFFPKLKVRKDIISEGWGMNLVNSRGQALRHLVNHIKDRNTAAEGDALTKALLTWYNANMSKELNTMLDAALDENEQPKLSAELVKGLYSGVDGSYRMSASRIEKFNGCPFSYYVAYGLAPREERAFKSDPRSIGDMYHDCLELVAREVLERKQSGEEIDDEELKMLVENKLYELADDYEGGLFLSTGAEEFHLDRIREICYAAAHAVATQIRTGAITDMKLEEDFGRKGFFKALEIEVDGQKVLVEGRIDRADIMAGRRIRIVDYKTGNDKLDTYKMAQGYKMQLMIYMMAAMQNEYRPVGLYYFNIHSSEENYNNLSEKKKKLLGTAEEGDSLKLKGKYIDEDGVLEMMPREVLAGSRDLSMSREAFDELKDAVQLRLDETAAALVKGDINVSPLSVDGQRIACTYCDYRAICRYDSSNAGNRSREIKGKQKEKSQN